MSAFAGGGQIVPACVATGLACLLNPYGLRGAIYPLELARTMSNPIFSHSIAELTPIPLFIEKSGLTSLPLQLHLVTMFLGALSFLVPLCWAITVRLRGSAVDSVAADKLSSRKPAKSSRARREEAQGCSRSGRGRRRLAAQSIPAALVRGFQRAQPSGHAQQPPVRGGGRLDHRLELRRVGRRPAPACRRSGSGEPWFQRTEAAPCHTHGGGMPCCSGWEPVSSMRRLPRAARSAGEKSRSGSPTRPSSSPARRVCQTAF